MLLGALSAFAAHTTSSALEDLHGLYPHLSLEEITEKVRAAENEFDFYRAFVGDFWFAWYHKAQHDPLYNPFSSTPEFRTEIMGDPHFENFGIFRTRGGALDFGPLDFDDHEQGDARADLMRFLVSAQYLDDVPPHAGELLQAYTKGFRGDARERSFALNQRMEKVQKHGAFAINRSWLGAEGHLNRTKFDEDKNFDESAYRKTEGQLRELFEPRYRVRDFAFRRRDYGGSAKLKRIMVALEMAPKTVVAVELKELIGSAAVEQPHRVRNTTSEIFRRVKNAKAALEISPVVDDVVILGETVYELRPKIRDRQALERLDHSPNDVAAISLDAAAVLGRLHAEGMSLSDRAEYAAALSELKREDIESAVAAWRAFNARHYQAARREAGGTGVALKIFF